jgi:hypothetical protein
LILATNEIKKEKETKFEYYDFEQELQDYATIKFSLLFKELIEVDLFADLIHYELTTNQLKATLNFVISFCTDKEVNEFERIQNDYRKVKIDLIGEIKKSIEISKDAIETEIELNNYVLELLGIVDRFVVK